MIENVGRRSEEWGNEGDPTDVGDASLNGYERNALYRGNGRGDFEDVGHLVGANRIEDSRAVAVADFDHDGRLDILVQTFNKPAVLLMGRGEVGNHLQVSLRARGANPDAIGAVLTAQVGERRLVRHVAVGSGFLSTSSLVQHFGLGEAERVDRLEVRWPDGEVQVLRDLQAGQRIEIRQAGGYARQAE